MDTSPSSSSVSNLASYPARECSVCAFNRLPPNGICQNGHPICLSCRTVVSYCCICHKPIGNIFNVANEMGNPKTFRTLQGENGFLIIDINLIAMDWILFQSCYGFTFMLVVKKINKYNEHKFYAIVQCIGSSSQAENFTYTLQLNGHERHLIWMATMLTSAYDNELSAIDKLNCFIFNYSTAQQFAVEGNLEINVTISRKTEESQESVTTNTNVTPSPACSSEEPEP